MEHKILASLYQEAEARQTKGRMGSQAEVSCRALSSISGGAERQAMRETSVLSRFGQLHQALENQATQTYGCTSVPLNTAGSKRHTTSKV